MITAQQLRQIFAPISGDQPLRICETLSGNINTILKIEVGDHLYGLRVRTQEHVYRYEPDLIKEVFISWLLDPDNSEKNDAEKATALARILTEKQGVGRNGSGSDLGGREGRSAVGEVLDLDGRDHVLLREPASEQVRRQRGESLTGLGDGGRRHGRCLPRRSATRQSSAVVTSGFTADFCASRAVVGAGSPW